MEMPEAYKNYNPADFIKDKGSYIVKWKDWKGTIHTYQVYAHTPLTAAFKCGQMHHMEVADVLDVRLAWDTDEMREMRRNVAESNIESFLELCENNIEKCTGSGSEYGADIHYHGDVEQCIVLEPVGNLWFANMWVGNENKFDEEVRSKPLQEKIGKLISRLESAKLAEAT